MKFTPIVVSFSLLLPLIGFCGESDNISTFSIVAYDPDNGDLGVAVASKFIAVGAVVPWAEAGVGAVATQAWGNTTYGPEGLALLEKGKSPEETIEILTSKDKKQEDQKRGGKEARQVGMVDASGRSATFTGKECFDWAGGIAGENFAVQGNILTGEEVVKAIADKFREAEGELADRLLAALEAGQKAGGDSRGRQSAALLVVREGGGYSGFNDRYIDLRIDEHPAPIFELKRVYKIYMEAFHDKRELGSRILYFQYGEDVKKLETILHKLGYLEENPDDVFKEATAEALKKFRKKHDLPDEYGYADEMVIKMLKDELERTKTSKNNDG